MCSNNARRDADFLQDFTIQIIGASLGPGLSSLGTTTRLKAHEESGTRSPKQMTDICARLDIQLFQLRNKEEMNVEVKRRQTATFFTAE